MSPLTRSGARASFSRFVGISLGGGRGKTTAVARIERVTGDPGAPLRVVEALQRLGRRGGTANAKNDSTPGDLLRDETLVRYLEAWVDDETVVAIDAPLTLPPCLRCSVPCPGVERCEVPSVVFMREQGAHGRFGRPADSGKPVCTPYTQRPTDLWLSAQGLTSREALGHATGPLAARAAYLRRVLSPRLRLHENLLEVNPRASLRRIFGEQETMAAHQGEASRIWAVRSKMLLGGRLGLRFEHVWPELVVRSLQVFHAVVAASAACTWAQGDSRGGQAGEPESAWLLDGWVHVP